jgi:hypothetical protein
MGAVRIESRGGSREEYRLQRGYGDKVTWGLGIGDGGSGIGDGNA